MESKEFLANIEKHLQRSGAVNRFIGHIMFVGLPGVGKSTLIARLLNLEKVEAMLEASGSTGVMDGIITVDVAEDEASMHAANIDENYEWHKVEFGLSCLRQMGMQCFVLEQASEDHAPKDHIPKDHAPESHTPEDCTPEDHTLEGQTPKDHAPESHTSEDRTPEDHAPDGPTLEDHVPENHIPESHTPENHTPEGHTLEDHTPEDHTLEDYLEATQSNEKRPSFNLHTRKRNKKPHLPMKAAATEEQQPEDVMATVLKLLNAEGFSAVRPYLDKKTSLYLSDTGGQIEFQELLPLLIAGLAIFVFLFPLNVDLDEQVTVSYRKKVKGKVERSNVYKSSLTIRESFLQTLASIDSMEGSSDPSVAKHNPYVFVVGTHKDCLVKKYGDGGAEKKIAEINFTMKGLITEHRYEKLIVPADNARDQVFFAVDNTCHNTTFGKIRSSIMGLVRSKEFRIQFPLSYLLASLYLQDSNKPFIKRSDFARNVLQYDIEEEDIDHLLLFLNTRIGQIRYFPLEEIREVIVKEPQALYNLVTILITKSFISHGVTMEEYSEVQRGIYSLESFDVDEFLSQSEFLTPKQVIHLLKELRIVAPFYDRAAGIEKYFIPFVLNHLPEAPVDDLSKASIVQPLAIMFDSGHCPKGMYGVLLHYILTHEKRQLKWYLDIRKISRNQVSFDVGPYEEEVNIKVCTTHLEVRYFPMDVAQRSQDFTVKKICNVIRSIFESGIKQATTSLHYSEAKTKHSFGLVCKHCCNWHRVNSECLMKCPKQRGLSFLPEFGLLWFPESPPSIIFPDLVDYISLKEHDDHSMDFTVTSDPSLEVSCGYSLSKEKGCPSKDHVFIQDTTVHFKRVRRSDAGTYIVSTLNAVGNGHASFQLKVKFPPKYILLKGKYLEAESGSSPTLTFTVTSDPPLAANTQHTLTKSDGSEAPPRFMVENNCITFHKVRVHDSGTYTISCCNDEGEVGQATLELEVTPPQPPTPHQPAHSSQGQGTILTGTVVRSGDVNMLMGLLHKCAYKWREIGAALNFQYHELENISAPNPLAPPQQMLTKLLSQWSQWPTSDHPDPPTLERLRDALRSGQVGLGAEASDLYDLRHALPSKQTHSYVLLKDKGGLFPRGQLLEKHRDHYRAHSHWVRTSRDCKLLSWAEVAVVTDEKECLLLDAIWTCEDRYNVYSTPGKLAWGLGLKVGDTVLARLPTEDVYSHAIIRWYGNVMLEHTDTSWASLDLTDVDSTVQKKIVSRFGVEEGAWYCQRHLFGVEIMDERHFECGVTDGEYCRERFFHCQARCGLFLTLAEMKPYQQEQAPLSMATSMKSFESELSEESQEFLANIKKHLERSGAVNRFLGHIMFVGLPGVGKSTLIARLLNLEEVEAMLKASGSTGVMDNIITVDVAEDEASMHAANVGRNCEWHKVEFGLSCLRQMGIQCFVLQQSTEDCTHVHPEAAPLSKGSPAPSITSESDESFEIPESEESPEPPKIQDRVKGLNSPKTQSVREKEKSRHHTKTAIDLTIETVQQKQSTGDVMATILKLLREEGYAAVHPYLEKKTSLYLSDTGGQIEFQELLPLLIAGLAIFVFLFPLNVDLDGRVIVSYRKKVKGKVKHSNIYESSLTIKESFLQTLASIDSIEGSSGPSVAKHKHYVLVVGTHKDCLVKELGEEGAEKRITQINGRMKGLIKEHKYEKLVVLSDKAKNQVSFAVDNTCHNATFGEIRSSIMDLIHSRDEFNIQFPLSYLLASLHLQDSSKPFIKRSDFARDVLLYGIREEDIDHLLQFLNNRIGQIRYFPVEGIREVIVKEPQALYNLVTFLITKSFISHGVTMEEYSEVQRGIYSLESFSIEEFLSQSEFLTPKQVIHLLKELRIVAPFYDRAAGIEKYFIPFVLNHLPESPVDDSSRKSIVQSLAIMFDCGHCPKGMYGVLLHYILTQEEQLDWYLDIDKISRDKVSFDVGPYEDEVSIRVHTTHLEVRYLPMDAAQPRQEAFTVKKICNAVRSTLESGIKEATKSLHYSQTKMKHSLGLVCTECSDIHKVDLQRMMKCPKQGDGLSFLPEYGLLWFPESPPSITFDLDDYIILKEHDDHSMNFKVTSDSSLGVLSKYSLYKEEGSCSEAHIFIRDMTVHFKRVRRSDAGTYTVSTFNAVGKGHASFQLKVKFPPVYSLELDYLKAEAGSSPAVTFTVTSDPPLPEGTEHALSRKGVEVTRRFKVESGCITFRDVEVEDSGTYTISCCNDDGEVGQAILELKVTPPQPPTPPHQPAHSSHDTTQTGTVVRSGDVNMLMGLLHKCAYKWREIGAALNFQYHELENISAPNLLAPPQQMLTKLLSQWSQWPTSDHPDPPTLERLRDALRSGQVGLGAEAIDLYELRHALPSIAQKNTL